MTMLWNLGSTIYIILHPSTRTRCPQKLNSTQITQITRWIHLLAVSRSIQVAHLSTTWESIHPLLADPVASGWQWCREPNLTWACPVCSLLVLFVTFAGVRHQDPRAVFCKAHLLTLNQTFPLSAPCKQKCGFTPIYCYWPIWKMIIIGGVPCWIICAHS